MKSCGIVAEYNPFHNGHRYQIEEAKRLSGADAVIVVMSGNFLQRGEPAIIDKWQRAEAALASGADLIIELPVAFSVQPADYFAKGAIALLQQLGCEALSFGSESGTGPDFHSLSEKWLKHKTAIDTAFQAVKNNGAPYAAQMQQAVQEVVPDSPLDLSAPNTVLGLAYARENAGYVNPMKLFPVHRVGSGHNEANLTEEEFQSGSALRKELLQAESSSRLQNVRQAMPEQSLQFVADSDLKQWESFWLLLKYQLTVQTEEELRDIYQMNEGIEYRLKQKVGQAKSFAQFVELVKSKRYSWVRLQRLFTYVLLQIKKETMQTAIKSPTAIRVLGFTEKGQQYLSERKKQVSIPIISGLNQKNKSLWEMDIKAGKVYALANKSDEAEQDFSRSPIRV